jgi:hypothetical protein
VTLVEDIQRWPLEPPVHSEVIIQTGSSFFLSFCSPFFVFFLFQFYIVSPALSVCSFIALPFSPLSFHLCFVSVFSALMCFISSLPQLVWGLNGLVVVVIKAAPCQVVYNDFTFIC